LPFLAEENTKINADLGVKLSTQKSTFDLLNQNQSQYLVTSLNRKFLSTKAILIWQLVQIFLL
jgi:hypothetical protein